MLCKAMHVNTLADSEASISAACTEVVFVNVRFCALTADGNNEGPIDCGPVEGDEFLHAVIDYIRREYVTPFPNAHFSLITLGPKSRGSFKDCAPSK